MFGLVKKAVSTLLQHQAPKTKALPQELAPVWEIRRRPAGQLGASRGPLTTDLQEERTSSLF